MEKKELTCICCPMGCQITVELNGGRIENVTGNTCKRGYDYAIAELTAPVRTVTSTVLTPEGVPVPVKTASPVPKDSIGKCIAQIKSSRTKLPARIGDIIIKNIASTGVDIVCTKDVG